MYQKAGQKKLNVMKTRSDKSMMYKMTHKLSLLPSYMQTQKTKPTSRGRELSIVPLPVNVAELRQLSVQAVVFLTSRPSRPDYGTLLTALSNGKVLVWSHHRMGGYMEQFNAIHMAGDSVSTMSVDPTETFLFTGTMLGYVKTWLLMNYWFVFYSLKDFLCSIIPIGIPVLPLKIIRTYPCPGFGFNSHF